MNESGHQFRRFARRMMGRRIYYQALCECGWISLPSRDETIAWAGYCVHSEEVATR
jgi:hypothetical protein